MQIDDYQQWTHTYWNKVHDWDDQVTHAVLGLNSEAGEVADIFQKARYSPRADVSPLVDRDKLIKEMGDVLFFLCRLADLYAIPMSRIMQANVLKLDKRYEQKED